MGIYLLIHKSHIAGHGKIRNTSPIASSRPIGLVCSKVMLVQCQDTYI